MLYVTTKKSYRTVRGMEIQMKKITALFLVFLTVILIGCVGQQETDVPDVKEEVIPPMTVRSGDEKVEPYVNPISSDTWSDGEWLTSDTPSFTEKLSECKDKIPNITYNSKFSVISNYGTSVQQMYVYDAESPSEKTLTNLSSLAELPAGNYYLSIIIIQKGDFIEAGNDSESTTSECVYYLVKG